MGRKLKKLPEESDSDYGIIVAVKPFYENDEEMFFVGR